MTKLDFIPSHAVGYTTARDALKTITTSPRGPEESMLDNTLPEIPGMGKTIAVLYEFSLLYRDGGFVKA